LRRRNDPEVKAKRKANAEAAAAAIAEGGIADPCHGLVVWADRGGELWPSLIQEKLSRDRCVIRYLGPLPSQSGIPFPAPSPAAAFSPALAKEVAVSSLARFPGGLPLMVLSERISPPPAEGASKGEKDALIRKEFSLAANKDRKMLQLAIDHAVRLCIVHAWKESIKMVNVVDGESLDRLGFSKRKRGTERQRRIDLLLAQPDQWVSPVDTRSSYDRFRVMFNNKAEGADPLCARLRFAESGLQEWIRSRRSPSATPSLAPASSASATQPQQRQESASDPAISRGGGSATTQASGTRTTEDEGSQSQTLSSHTPPDPEAADCNGGVGAARGDDQEDLPNGPGAAPGNAKPGEGKGKLSASSASAAAAEGGPAAGKGKGKANGKANGGGNDLTSREAGESTAAGVAAGEGVAADVDPPSDFVEIEEGTRPYTADELVARLRALSERLGVPMDKDYYDNLIGQRVRVDLAKARGEDPASVEGGGGRKDSSSDGSGSGNSAAAAAATPAASKGKGKRKSAGTHAEDTAAGAAEDKNEPKIAATGGATTAPSATANPTGRKRRLQDLGLGNEDAAPERTVPPGEPASGGDSRRDSREQGAGGADDPGAAGQARQGHGAKRRKGDQTTAAASDGCDVNNGSDGGGVGGGEAEEEAFSCGGGGSDFEDEDDEPASVPPPPRPPSSRREGASKPAQERALARSLLGKGKAVSAKLKDKTPISAGGGSGSGSGSAYLIPKKASATGEASTKPKRGGGGGGGGSGSGSASGGAMSTIPKKAIPRKSSSGPGNNSDAPRAAQQEARVATSRSGSDIRLVRGDSGNDPRTFEDGGDSAVPVPSKPRKPMSRDSPEAVEGFEENVTFHEGVEEDCKQKLLTGGAYLGTHSKNAYWEKLQRSTELGNRFTERTTNVLRALARARHKGADEGVGDEDEEENSGSTTAGDRMRGF
ncbi:unnamed protein product, partial [Scytosiphon promiscuus]